MRSRLYSSMSDAAAHASIGQGNPWSLPCHALSTHRLSIVGRLASRSLTGRGLQILVHQHFGYRLHLEWSGNTNNENSVRFIERRFQMWDEAESFTTQLSSLGFEGLCTCAYEASYLPPHAKALRCHRGPFYSSQKHLLLPKWELKSMEDMAVTILWGCNITSTSPNRVQW